MSVNKVDEKRIKEQKTIEEMIKIYCKGVHNEKELCDSCRELLEYSRERSAKCPFMEEKTFCSNCKVHCYKHEMRAKIKEVMKYSGPRMLLHHPVMALSHVYYTIKNK